MNSLPKQVVLFAAVVSSACRATGSSTVKDVGQVDPTESMDVPALISCHAHRQFEGIQLTLANVSIYTDARVLQGAPITGASRLTMLAALLDNDGETYGDFQEGVVVPSSIDEESVRFKFDARPVRHAKSGDSRRCAEFEAIVPRWIPKEVGGTSEGFTIKLAAKCTDMAAGDIDSAQLACRGNYGSDPNSPANPHAITDADRDECFKLAGQAAQSVFDTDCSGDTNFARVALIRGTKVFFFEYGCADRFNGRIAVTTVPTGEACRVEKAEDLGGNF